MLHIYSQTVLNKPINYMLSFQIDHVVMAIHRNTNPPGILLES